METGLLEEEVDLGALGLGRRQEVRQDLGLEAFSNAVFKLKLRVERVLRSPGLYEVQAWKGDSCQLEVTAGQRQKNLTLGEDRGAISHDSHRAQRAGGYTAGGISVFRFQLQRSSAKIVITCSPGGETHLSTGLTVMC